MEKVCQEALQASLDAIRPGATCEAPHLACQKVIDRAGFTENFKKRTGYSIGIALRRTGAKAAFSQSVSWRHH
ncbi:M24 family metallopeptidase [Klebsiella variicola subsp. variicola]|nr:M24 family metallopeptidase [Klebsiella variicola subsp. variicola]